MRLLNTRSLELGRLLVPSEVPEYAILSHRWNTEEITFANIISTSIFQFQMKNGFAKIQGACRLALQHGYEWIWIDSCCIDKSSSAELQEAINSMWRYYAHSNICYVYLADVPDLEAGWGPMFSQSEWFRRGWTLQELLAPVRVEFYAENWALLGTKFERFKQIAKITSIDPDALVRVRAIDSFCTAQRMSWAAHRCVTRDEDESYSLLGLFDVNVPLLYGEGREKAFVRLQEAIYNATVDQSIFLFRFSYHKDRHPLLANSPTRFCDKRSCSSCRLQGPRNVPLPFPYSGVVTSERWCTQAHEQLMTNVTTVRNEMSTVLPLLDFQNISDELIYFDLDKDTIDALRDHTTHVAVLNCTLNWFPQGAFCLLLHREPVLGVDVCVRLEVSPAFLSELGSMVLRLQKTKLLICPGPSTLENEDYVDVIFSVSSDLFRLEKWDSVTGAISIIGYPIPSAQPGKCPDFRIPMRKFWRPADAFQVFCQLSSTHDPKILLTIQLVRLQETWSIKEIFEHWRCGEIEPPRTLFVSALLADRCPIRFLDGQELSVQLRRLPSSTRIGKEGTIIGNRYQILVDAL